MWQWAHPSLSSPRPGPEMSADWEYGRGRDSQQAWPHGGPVTLVTLAGLLGPQSPPLREMGTTVVLTSEQRERVFPACHVAHAWKWKWS